MAERLGLLRKEVQAFFIPSLSAFSVPFSARIHSTSFSLVAGGWELTVKSFRL
jgi:hypothetical protein